ncbi:MAG: hypothetical protein ACK4P3_06720 [Fimbriimonadaceae bacterium]
MKLFTRIAVGTVLVGSLGTAALAQETEQMGLSIRAGTFWPTSSIGRDQGNVWFGAGVEYRLKQISYGTMDRESSSYFTVSFDYVGKGSLQSFPLLINYVQREGQFYFTGGAGVSFARTFRTTFPFFSTRNQTLFAYQVGVGYDFDHSANSFFVEGKFMGTGNSQLNGFGLYLGVRL